MIISKETQLEMYNYLVSNKTTGLKYIDGDFQYFILNEIKVLSRKLDRKTELFVRKASIARGLNSDNEEDTKLDRADTKLDKVTMIKNYNCLSNQLIRSVIEDIPECRRFIPEELKKYTIDNKCRDAHEVGTKDRKKLIRLCKLYLDNKEIEIASKSKSSDRYELEKESSLAEKVLGKYSKEELNYNIKASSQKIIKKATDKALGLKADIVLENENVVIIIDVKVYSTIGEAYYNKFRYSSNKNRYQLNSYIGAYLDTVNNSDKKIYGILLHIVDDKLWNKNIELQSSDQTIENDRPIILYMIQDKGLEYILNEYNKLINSYLN